jgi:hypothetical protein
MLCDGISHVSRPPLGERRGRRPPSACRCIRARTGPARGSYARATGQCIRRLHLPDSSFRGSTDSSTPARRPPQCPGMRRVARCRRLRTNSMFRLWTLTKNLRWPRRHARARPPARQTGRQTGCARMSSVARVPRRRQRADDQQDEQHVQPCTARRLRHTITCAALRRPHPARASRARARHAGPHPRPPFRPPRPAPGRCANRVTDPLDTQWRHCATSTRRRTRTRGSRRQSSWTHNRMLQVQRCSHAARLTLALQSSEGCSRSARRFSASTTACPSRRR